MQTNLNYQRQLAESLVTGLGVEAAMDFARRNEWDGVLAHICLGGAGADTNAGSPPHDAPREAPGHGPKSRRIVIRSN